MTCLPHEETVLLTVLQFPFRVRTPDWKLRMLTTKRNPSTGCNTVHDNHTKRRTFSRADGFLSGSYRGQMKTGNLINRIAHPQRITGRLSPFANNVPPFALNLRGAAHIRK
jgi:hypothetical protein